MSRFADIVCCVNPIGEATDAVFLQRIRAGASLDVAAKLKEAERLLINARRLVLEAADAANVVRPAHAVAAE